MILNRYIIPAGFGAFCIEQFLYGDNLEKRFTVVYDCGAKYKEGKDNIRSAIQLYFNDCTVDLLFISHFHDDHINMVKDLPFSDKSVIIIPFVSAPDIKLYDLITNSKYEELQNTLEQLKDKYHLKLFYAQPFDEKQEVSFDNFISLDSNEQGLLKVNVGICIEGINWLYTPCHLQDNHIYNIIETELYSYIGSLKIDWNNNCVVSSLKKKCKELIEEQKIVEDINSTSMLLVSKGKDIIVASKHCSGKINKDSNLEECDCDNEICVYNGDVCFNEDVTNRKSDKESLLNKALYFYKMTTTNKIGLLQISHHGSEFSYNRELLEQTMPSCTFVNGTYRNTHPIFFSTIPKDCNELSIVLFQVMEEKGSLLEQTVEYREKDFDELDNQKNK